MQGALAAFPVELQAQYSLPIAAHPGVMGTITKTLESAAPLLVLRRWRRRGHAIQGNVVGPDQLQISGS